MTDIRVVMIEVGKLQGEMASLQSVVDKQSDRVDTSLEKHSAALSASIEKAIDRYEKITERQTADLKERLVEQKADLKALDGKVDELRQKVSFVKGAMWVLGGLFALAAVLLGVAARTWFA